MIKWLFTTTKVSSPVFSSSLSTARLKILMSDGATIEEEYSYSSIEDLRDHMVDRLLHKIIYWTEDKTKLVRASVISIELIPKADIK